VLTLDRDVTLRVAATFAYLGGRPVAHPFLGEHCRLDEDGYVLTEPGRAVVPGARGLFVAGDLAAESPGGVAAAVGQGAIAVRGRGGIWAYVRGLRNDREAAERAAAERLL
jgi:thioredoxin reductase